MMWEDNYMNAAHNTNNITSALAGLLGTQVVAFIALLNLNNSLSVLPTYAAVEAGEVGKKYLMVNNVLTNGQRSARFMIDAEGVVYASGGWKVRGRRIGTIERLMAEFSQANKSLAERKRTASLRLILNFSEVK